MPALDPGYDHVSLAWRVLSSADRDGGIKELRMNKVRFGGIYIGSL